MPTISPPAAAEPSGKTSSVPAGKSTPAPVKAPEPTAGERADAHLSDSMRELEELDIPVERPAPKAKEKKVEAEPTGKTEGEPKEPVATDPEPEVKPVK